MEPKDPILRTTATLSFQILKTAFHVNDLHLQVTANIRWQLSRPNHPFKNVTKLHMYRVNDSQRLFDVYDV